jgi:hypothetical protein
MEHGIHFVLAECSFDDVPIAYVAAYNIDVLFGALKHHCRLHDAIAFEYRDARAAHNQALYESAAEKALGPGDEDGAVIHRHGAHRSELCRARAVAAYAAIAPAAAAVPPS